MKIPITVFTDFQTSNFKLKRSKLFVLLISQTKASQAEIFQGKFSTVTIIQRRCKSAIIYIFQSYGHSLNHMSLELRTVTGHKTDIRNFDTPHKEEITLKTFENT